MACYWSKLEIGKYFYRFSFFLFNLKLAVVGSIIVNACFNDESWKIHCEAMLIIYLHKTKNFSLIHVNFLMVTVNSNVESALKWIPCGVRKFALLILVSFLWCVSSCADTGLVELWVYYSKVLEYSHFVWQEPSLRLYGVNYIIHTPVFDYLK